MRQAGHGDDGRGAVEAGVRAVEELVEQDLLPPVRLHVFYNRRVADVADRLPKYAHYWPSQFAITKTIMGF